MIERSDLIHLLDMNPSDSADPALIQRVKIWLRRDDTRLLRNKPAKVTVSEALRLWSTRVKNTDVTGLHLEGAEALITQLKGFTPQRKLEQFALIGSETTGNLFFEGSSHRFVGAVLVPSNKAM